MVDHSVLDALGDLGVQLATTNYDGLLEKVTGLPAVTWQEPNRVLQGDETGILHLHGYWEFPESVVFGRGSYNAVLGSEHAQAVLRSLLLTKTLIYVGFGAGLDGPNFAQFRDWASRVIHESEYRHYRLARSDEREAIQRKHPPSERVVAVSFGDSHVDLEPFLRSLKASTIPEQGNGSAGHPASKAAPHRMWSIPHRYNPDLVGRDKQVEEIANRLDQGGAAVVQANASVQAIHGLGGIGKTQLAVAYAYRYKDGYDLVWWIRSEDQATLVLDLTALGLNLGIKTETYERQEDTVAAVHRALEDFGGRWLLIFDNAESHASIAPFVPACPGHVLVTTRSRDWPRSYEPVALDLLTPDDAAKLLLKQAGFNDDLNARRLAEALGYLPLALVQASAFLRLSGLSFEGYLERFQHHQAGLLERGRPADYPATVLTTWELSFMAAIETAPASEGLMNLLAYMAPEAIPLDLFTRKGDGLPDSVVERFKDELNLEDAVAALRGYSLIERVDDSTLSVHRLVQFASRNRLSVAEQQHWAEAALALVAAAFPVDAHDVRYREDAARLFAHGNAALSLSQDLGIVSAPLEQLMNRLGRFLIGSASYPKAREMFERALVAVEEVHGAESSVVAMDLNDLASVLQAQGALPQARELQERALAIREQQLGPDHPDTAASLGNLASMLRDLGKGQLKGGSLPEAHATLQMALRLFRRVDALREAQATLSLISDVNKQEKQQRRTRRGHSGPRNTCDS